MRRKILILFAAFLFLLPAASVYALDFPKPVFVARLRGSEEVPPVPTIARGIAIFTVKDNGSAIDYKLFSARLENPVQAHIHLAPQSTNGGVVATLYGSASPNTGVTNGKLSDGTITAADLSGPLAGQPLSALIEAMRQGNAYVNVHTDDGIAPLNSGPGDFVAGEIRGQIE